MTMVESTRKSSFFCWCEGVVKVAVHMQLDKPAVVVVTGNT